MPWGDVVWNLLCTPAECLKQQRTSRAVGSWCLEVAVAPLHSSPLSMPRGRHSPPHPPRDWHCINYGAFRLCPKKRKWSLIWGRAGALFVSHLCSLCCMPLPWGCVWLTAPQSSLRSVWPATLNSRLPRPTLFLPSHLHANSLFTAYALPPLAMNSVQGRLSPANKMQQGTILGRRWANALQRPRRCS